MVGSALPSITGVPAARLMHAKQQVSRGRNRRQDSGASHARSECRGYGHVVWQRRRLQNAVPSFGRVAGADVCEERSARR